MKTIFLVFFLALYQQVFTQTCFTISNRTNGNGNPGTCGSPNCSGAAKTGHIDVSFGASCPGVIPALVLTAVTSGSLPNPFCFDPGNCISPGTVRYCFRGNNLPSSGFMTLNFTQGASVWSCMYDVTGGAGTVLPIKLISFDAKLQDDKAIIKWTTAEERNNEKFEIERAGEDKSFTVVGTVTSLGNSSSPVSYEFTDVSPLRGLSFYRLKQIDIDNRSGYSLVRRVDNRIKGIQIKQLFPNPVADNATLQIISDKTQSADIKIYDRSGKLVITEQKVLHPGDQNWQLNTSRLAPGIYEIIIISKEGNEISERMVKQ